jgi:polyisoprenoid-binding protein YceI
MTTTSKWVIDPMHSEIQFKVRHLAISNVTGTIRKFQGSVISEGEDFGRAQVHVTMEPASIDTNNTDRDGHLRSEIFLDTERYPLMRYEGILQKEGGEYLLQGTLTIRDITLPVTLPVSFTGVGKGRFGDERAGFEASGVIHRKDFGLTWNMVAEGGGLIVGEDIKLHFDIQMIRQ